MDREGQNMTEATATLNHQAHRVTREILIPELKISEGVRHTASRIAARHRRLHGEGIPLVILGVLKSAAMFSSALTLAIEKQGVPTQMDFVQASSYGENTVAEQLPVLTWTSHPETLHDRHVLLAEDMIDTGETLKRLVEVLLEVEPSSLHIAVLLEKEKKGAQPVQFPVSVDVTFPIPDLWVDGYGIDTANKHRGLSDIWAVLRSREDMASWREYRSRSYGTR